MHSKNLHHIDSYNYLHKFRFICKPILKTLCFQGVSPVFVFRHYVFSLVFAITIRSKGKLSFGNNKLPLFDGGKYALCISHCFHSVLCVFVGSNPVRILFRQNSSSDDDFAPRSRNTEFFYRFLHRRHRRCH